jgi:CRP-like cAMP-binding protein
MTVVELLRGVPVFRPVDDDVLQAIADEARRVTFSPGTRFITEGQMDDDAYLIVSGEAEVSVRNRAVARRGPGDMIGEVAAVTARARTASVTARTSVDALVLTPEVLRDMMRRFPNFAAVMTRAMSQLASG